MTDNEPEAPSVNDSKTVQALDAQLLALQARAASDLLTLSATMSDAILGSINPDRLHDALDRIRQTVGLVMGLPLPSAVLDPDQPNVTASIVPPSPPPPGGETPPLVDDTPVTGGEGGAALPDPGVSTPADAGDVTPNNDMPPPVFNAGGASATTVR